jgi:three-Cys-motif partner protein
MATGPITWKCEDHTAVKHNLLRAFFVKWVSVHSGYFTQTHGGLVRIYDGFAGPGVYEDGKPGSPRISTSHSRSATATPRSSCSWTRSATATRP